MQAAVSLSLIRLTYGVDIRSVAATSADERWHPHLFRQDQGAFLPFAFEQQESPECGTYGFQRILSIFARYQLEAYNAELYA